MKNNEDKSKIIEKHAMLDELQSIKELLLENSNEFDIPTLDHPLADSVQIIADEFITNDISIIDTASTPSEFDTNNSAEELEQLPHDQPSDTKIEASNKLVQQQNLFQEFGLTKAINDKSIVKARGENPFLPKHIRDRLHGDRPVLSGNVIEPLSGSATGEVDEIVDNLISEFLPEIEAKLRSRLKPLIEQHIQHGQSEEPS